MNKGDKDMLISEIHKNLIILPCIHIKNFVRVLIAIDDESKIYGFGSCFEGTWTEYSDIDIMMIGDMRKAQHMGVVQAIFRALTGLDFHVNFYPDMETGLNSIPCARKITRLYPGID